MQIKLDIKDDKELRNYMKDYLKGLVTTISREEVSTQIVEAAIAKVENLKPRQIREFIELDSDVLHEVIKSKLGEYTAERMEEAIDYRLRADSYDTRLLITSTVKAEMQTFKKEVLALFAGALTGQEK